MPNLFANYRLDYIVKLLITLCNVMKPPARSYFKVLPSAKFLAIGITTATEEKPSKEKAKPKLFCKIWITG